MNREPLKGEWGNSRLTTQEAEKALAAAGIPTDPIEWSDEDMRQAGSVLDAAAAEKRRNA